MFKRKGSRKLKRLESIGFFDLKEKISAVQKLFKKKLESHNKCQGVYCNYKEYLENALIDEKDELNNLYMMTDEENETPKKIEFKSIVLDIVEKENTFKRLQTHTNIPLSNLKKLKQGLQLRFRKFFSVTQLKESEKFKHLNYVHFFQKQQVCQICFAMYNKLDHMRTDSQDTINYFVKFPEKIQEEINRYETEIGKAYDVLELQDRKVFSEDFYQDLKNFDEQEIPL